jgi:DNA-binding SARP family transcriptional activator
MSFSLKVLGGISVTGDRGPLTGPAVQRHRLALLAILATSRPRAVSRDKLMAWLWPERDGERARQLLNQAVHALRRTLGPDAILSTGDELQLNAAVVRCDVVDFEEALAESQPERAAALYGGPFLDGFFLDDAPEFEHWVDRERDRLASSCAAALEELAEAAERTGPWAAAVGWWKARSAQDPYDSRVALRLVQALERAGNRAGALQQALLHQRRLRQDLEIEPAPELSVVVERLRQEPGPLAMPADRMERPIRERAAPAHAVAPLSAPPVPAPSRRRTLLGVLVVLTGCAIGYSVWRVSGDRRAAMATPAVVDQIARAVAREIGRRERGDTTKQLPEYRTRSIPAYELYLRGNDPALLRSDSGARLGLEYFRRAVALDSTYAAAWAGLARMTLRVAGDGSAAAEARAAAETAAQKAVALDDSLAEGHAILGVLRTMAYDFPAAERHYTQAIALEPNRSRYREWAANFYVLIERPAEALLQAERALALDPLSPSATAEVARALLANGRCDEALARLDAIKALDPPLLRAAPIAAHCFALKRMWREAGDQVTPQARLGERESVALLGYMLAREGRQDTARAIQTDLLRRWRDGAVGAYYLAFIPAALGERDEAFGWLDRSYEDGSLSSSLGGRVGLIDPLFDDLLPDPRMATLRRRLGLQNR